MSERYIPIARPIIGEEEKCAVLDVLDGRHLAQGEITRQLESHFAEYCEAEHAIATSSGTTALHLALLAAGIGPSDEVITTPFTFIASANSVLYCGAKPVFVDIDPDTFNIDHSKIESKITAHTKAILPVHLYGNPADMMTISEIADRYGIAIIEDAAQAHGAKIGGKPIGSKGTACFSFYPTKNITTGEGGMIVTDNSDIAERCRLLRSHGAKERYVHEILGYNCRMTDIHAAIGLAQLPKLAEWTMKRKRNAHRLTELLGDHVITPVHHSWADPVYHQYTIRIPGGRGDLAARMENRQVGVGIHYPVPVHLQPLYQKQGYCDSLPEAEKASQEVISLPVHPNLSDQDLQRIASAVIQSLEGA